MTAHTGLGLWALALAASACGGMNASLGSENIDGDQPVEVTRLGSTSPEPVAENVDANPESDEQGAPAERRPPRPAVTPSPFRITDLPLAVIPPPPDDARAPHGLSGPTPQELIIERTSGEFADVRVRVPEKATARIQINGVESTSWDGLRIKCNIRRRTAVGVRWEVLERLPKGRVRYSVVNGWFDAASCNGAVSERTSFELHPVVPNVLYGYRECGKSCAEHQTVTFVGPALKQVTANAVGGPARATLQPFGKVTLDLERGSGSSVMARIGAPALAPWFSGKRPSWAAGSDDVFIGVDVVQAVGDPEPIAVAYVGRTPPGTVQRNQGREEPIDFIE